MSKLRLPSFLFLFLATSLVTSPPAAQDLPSFTGTTSVVVVEVPVNVTKGGAPVRGLTAEHFAIYDGKKLRPLLGFETVDLAAIVSTAGSAKAPVPITARRHFLLLFDLSFNSASSLQAATRAGRELLDTALHDSDLIAIGLFGLTQQAGLVLGFTPDRAAARQVLDDLETLFSGKAADRTQKKGSSATKRTVDPLRLGALDFSTLAVDIGRAIGSETSHVDELLEEGNLSGYQADLLSDMSDALSNRARERSRSQVAVLSRSLSELAHQTRQLEGRKYLVYFSEGFASDLLFEEGGARTLRDLDRMVKEFQRSGWVLQSVDPSGSRGVESLLDSHDGLLAIAKETGGELYANFSRLDTAMESMLEKTSVTYLLTFEADDVPADGAFHPLRVELRDAPKGAKVSHRAGYYAPEPGPPQKGLAGQLQLAERLLRGDEGGSLDGALLAVPFPAAQEIGQVAVWIDISGADLVKDLSGDALELEIYGYALDADGGIGDAFSQQATLDLSKLRSHLAEGRLRFLGDFSLPVGHYDLRLLVRNRVTGQDVLRRAAVEVSHSDDQPRLLPPLFLADEAIERFLVLRESGADASSFMIGERPFVPAVQPLLKADQPSRICLIGYHLDSADLTLETRILDSGGSPLPAHPLSIVGKNDAGESSQLYFSLDVKSLVAGDYTLEISVTQASGASDRVTAPFRVGS